MFTTPIGSQKKLSKNSTPLNLQINGTPVEAVKHIKLLGVTIDQCLTWENHIQQLCSQLSSRLALLQRIKKYLPYHVRILYYNAYCLPILDYCCSIWGSASKASLDCILKLQKRAARIILNANYLTPSFEMFKTLKWMTIYDRIYYQKAVLMFKCLRNLSPAYLSDQFVPTASIYKKSLRSTTSLNMYVPKPNTELFKHTFLYSGVILWNNLSLQTKQSENLNIFKKRLEKSILSKYVK